MHLINESLLERKEVERTFEIKQHMQIHKGVICLENLRSDILEN
jgi:hypothetical protein